jgi:hypothetical protein
VKEKNNQTVENDVMLCSLQGYTLKMILKNKVENKYLGNMEDF